MRSLRVYGSYRSTNRRESDRVDCGMSMKIRRAFVLVNVMTVRVTYETVMQCNANLLTGAMNNKQPYFQSPV